MTVYFERIEKFFNYLLVFLLPTQLAFHFWPPSAFVFGIRVDYLAPTVYLTDFLFLVLFAVWLKDNWHQFSSFISKHKFSICVILAVAAFNTFFSISPAVTICKWLKIIELSTFAFYIWCRRDVFGTKISYLSLYLSLIFFSLIGIVQFIKGATLGKVLYFLGERSFNISTPGIALINFSGNVFLRAYSTFPHPNAFAGFLGVGVLILINFYFKKFSKKALGLIVILFAFLLTFSLSAFLAAVFCGILYVMFRKNKLKKGTLSALTLLFFLVSLILPWISKNLIGLGIKFSETVTQRLDLAIIAGKIISSRFMLGSGLNTFIISEARGVIINSHYWLLQPVHNIYLLIMSEIGVGGILLLFLLFSRILSVAFYYKRVGIFLAIIFVMTTGLFDHYWLTLQQNMLLFAFLAGISFRDET